MKSDESKDHMPFYSTTFYKFLKIKLKTMRKMSEQAYEDALKVYHDLEYNFE